MPASLHVVPERLAGLGQPLVLELQLDRLAPGHRIGVLGADPAGDPSGPLDLVAVGLPVGVVVVVMGMVVAVVVVAAVGHRRLRGSNTPRLPGHPGWGYIR